MFTDYRMDLHEEGDIKSKSTIFFKEDSVFTFFLFC